MLKCAAIGIALFATVWPAKAAEPTPPQDVSAVLRTITGVRFALPPGWTIVKFDGEFAEIAHFATLSGEKDKQSTPNYLYVDSRRQEPDDDFDKNWDQLDRDSERSFPGGVTARWKAGKKFNSYHHAFSGEVRVGSKFLHVFLLQGQTQTFDASILEAAFLHIAETLHDVPATKVLYHPALGIAATKLVFPPWQSRVDGRSLLFLCNPSADQCGEGSRTWIDAYPSAKPFPNVQEALADITGFFEKEATLMLGEVKHLKFEGGEASWTEQPGSTYPFLGAVVRDGRTYFVQMRANNVQKLADKALRPHFLSVLRSVRAWDGK
jgi:hypothetical protein